MTKVKPRTIGHNSGNINPIGEEAIALIQQMHDNFKVLEQKCYLSFNGKNNWERKNSALEATVLSKEILEKFDSGFKVIDAKARGVDVHHAPIKTHKLEIVSGNKTRFGQWLINRNEDC